jgi:hypothetical protein
MFWILAQPCNHFRNAAFACAIVQSLVTNRKLGVNKRLGADASPGQASPFVSLLDGHRLVFMCDTLHVVCCVVHNDLPFFATSGPNAQIFLMRVWMAAFTMGDSVGPSALATVRQILHDRNTTVGTSTVRAPRRRLSALSVSHSKSDLYGALVWAVQGA